MMMKFPKPLLGIWMVCVGFAGVGEVGAQQTIANPLVRPASVGNSSGGGPNQAPKADPNATQAPPAGSDVRDKAVSRISQEDFNLRQQALNASSVPAPLSSLFNQMSVSAFVGGSVVLRRADFIASTQGQQAAQNISPQQGNNAQSSGGGAVRSSPAGVQTGGTVVTSSVLRLKAGQNTNINGYLLRARVEDMNVFVEWKNEQGAWVSVFFGALESTVNLSLTPTKDSLEKVDTSSFDYLKPQVTSRIIGNSSSGTNNQNGTNQNSSFGSGSSTTGSTSSF